MAGWILKLVLLYLVIRAVMRIVRGVVDGLRGTIEPPTAVPAGSVRTLNSCAIRGASSAFTHASRSSARPALSPEVKGDSSSSREEPP